MTMTWTRQQSPASLAGLSRLFLLLVVSAASAGCGAFDRLLGVDAPTRVLTTILEDPSTAAIQVVGVVADFECAFSNYIVAAGTAGDELVDANLTGPGWPVDRRDLGDAGNNIATSGCVDGLPGLYDVMHTARYQGDQVAERLQGWSDAQVPNRQSLLATSLAYAGYAVLHLAEAMCSLTIDMGPELTRAQGFTEAETRFTAAIAAAQAANNTEMLHLAYLGRARARLNLAQANGTITNPAKLAEAAADAGQIPAGFRKNVTAEENPARRRNGVANRINFSSSFSVEDDFWNVTDMGVKDPRVSAINANRPSIDNITPLWTQGKYPARSSPIRLASYTEAQLIIAEAVGGQTAVDVINALHSAAGIPPFPGGTAAEIRAHVIAERASEFWLEGHHLGDKLRYGLPFTPAAGAPYLKGGVYGTDTCLQLPVQEKQNNPNTK
jgi:starch-binding outer membrane protein, SusD/RagB family